MYVFEFSLCKCEKGCVNLPEKVRDMPHSTPRWCYVLANVANINSKCKPYFYKMCNLQRYL